METGSIDIKRWDLKGKRISVIRIIKNHASYMWGKNRINLDVKSLKDGRWGVAMMEE